MAVPAAENLVERTLTMKRLLITLAVSAALAADFTAFSAPAQAQAGQFTVVVYGNDPCPQEAICIRKGESERYRIPPALNPQGTLQQRQSWSQKSKVLTTVGETGTGSCSAVGPGGHTGCLIKSIKQAKSQTRQNAEDQRPPE
jgi:hypothetical protein